MDTNPNHKSLLHELSPGATVSENPVLLDVDTIHNLDTNREPDAKRVARIVETFSPLRLDPVRVSMRKDGELVVFEGGHRVKAFKEMQKCGKLSNTYNDFKSIPAWLFRGLSSADENFLAYTFDADRKKQQAGNLGKFRQGFADPMIVRIVEGAKEFGFTVEMSASKRSTADNQLASIGGIERGIKENGVAAYKNALKLQREAWDGIRAGLREEILTGMIKFFGNLKNDDVGFKADQGVLDWERLVDMLRGDMSPTALIEESNLPSAVRRRETRMARALVRLYNQFSTGVHPTLKSNQQLVMDGLLTKTERKYFRSNKFKMKNGEVVINSKYN